MQRRATTGTGDAMGHSNLSSRLDFRDGDMASICYFAECFCRAMLY